ncbi:Cinnamoyl-coa reductase protein [Thalictrum thalictroides]|uniref:Cinnamoyl-coa reductase protein n=1 Tax=Thalictrum thalictroides TaxID=46969 RepID=A0A7J6XAL0_THATH|nr:Cinnamoyl-coa reductase protein [Thalictrum thalictroides]
MAPAMFETSKKVCVMDASGYLGSSLVDKLIQRGYTVHAAVQDHGDLQVLKGLSCDKKKLRIFQADPLDYHSIIDALRDCSALFYSFEPPRDQPIIKDEYLADEEVRAAHNVLEACAQTDTIEKVVFTSSVTAVIWKEDRLSINDEKTWTDVNFCRKFKLWHALAKTLAEKTAWALAMDRGVQMVSINSGVLVGPDLSIKNPCLKGAAEMYQNGVLVTVDLEYLVEAHICIFEDVSTYGRYLCFNNIINHPDDAVKFAQMLTPSSTASSLPQSIGDTRISQQRITCQKLEKVMVDFKS